ncbi:MAG: glutathione transferase GstA [Alphaproteobacteria bacterium]|nr:glutathione transferase GstA [Alphaproteobacteria bacterium]
MKLYYSPGACSLASHIVAEELGLKLDYEKVDLKEHKTEHGADYYAINPKGAVPAIALDENRLLTENVAILTYLGDQKPEAELVPRPGSFDRTRLLEWLGFLSSEIHKAYAPLFHGSEEEKTKARQTLDKHFGYVDKKLTGRPFLNGESLSVADAYLFVMLTWAGKTGVDLSKYRNLPTFRDRISKRPAVRRAMQMEELV